MIQIILHLYIATDFATIVTTQNSQMCSDYNTIPGYHKHIVCFKGYLLIYSQVCVGCLSGHIVWTPAQVTVDMSIIKGG